MRSALTDNRETERVLRYVGRFLPPGGLVVDVGCGYGRILRELRGRGVAAVGIEINASIRESNRSEGLDCMAPEEFARKGVSADLVIMSHVVEHFAPRDLVSFMDGYLDCLRPEGHLIIATPLLHSQFFDDFDHVKPYHPTGFEMVFGASSAQVQYYARNRLRLVHLWFRRSPLRAVFVRGGYVRHWTRGPWKILNAFGVLAFRASGGLIGRNTGWVGVFHKTNAGAREPE